MRLENHHMKGNGIGVRTAKSRHLFMIILLHAVEYL